MESESVSVQGHKVIICAHRGRNDRAGLIAFTGLMWAFWLIVTVTILMIFASIRPEQPDVYSYGAEVALSPEANPFIGRLVTFMVFFSSIILPVLLARWILTKLRKMIKVEVALDEDFLRIRRAKIDYTAIIGIEARRMFNARGIIWGLLTLIITASDKLTMLIFGRILPEDIKRSYSGDSFFVVLKCDAIFNTDRVVPGVYYSSDTANEVMSKLRELIDERKKAKLAALN